MTIGTCRRFANSAAICLRTGQQFADRLLLPRVALVHRPALCAFDQVERGVRRRSGAVDGVVDVVPRAPEDLVGVRPVRRRAFERTVGERACERERVVDELDGFEQAVGDPELGDVGSSEHPVLP
ncbi:MAG: hypothetical protein AUG91_00640 [Actinobacteria bacterium 13_1_20CM_4_69_9]|nr:MAG: hypothetical protein AUG91_00640 [Actinobacteria bacterium 13_1_20CM_4_69_9]